MLKKQKLDLLAAIEAFNQAERAASRALSAALLVLDTPSLALAKEAHKLIGFIGQSSIPAHPPITLSDFISVAVATSTNLLDKYTWIPSLFQNLISVKILFSIFNCMN